MKQVLSPSFSGRALFSFLLQTFLALLGVQAGMTAPDLVISKSSVSTFQQGGTATYTLIITNIGDGPTTSTFTVTDTMPTGLTLGTPAGAGFNFTASTASQLSAVSTSPLPATGTRVISLPVNIAANAPASITNTASVSGGGETNTGNNAGSVTKNVTQIAPELTITKVANGTFQQGGSAAYTITVTNGGNGPTTSPFTVLDIIPTGLIPVLPLSAADWNCASSTTSLITCTSTAPLAAGASRAITLPVNITANAPASITNTVNVSGGGDSNTGNNAGSAVVNVTQIAPELTITKIGNGPFQQGGSASYTITVTNNGNGPTTSPFTVLDIIPTGLIPVLPLSAADWNCASSTTSLITCTSTAPLAAGASRTLTLPVNITANAPASITNTVNVSGGGDSNTGNNAGSSVVNVTQIAPELTITKIGNGPFQQGGSASYTITVTNNGNGPTSSPFTVTDIIPTGLIPVLPLSSADWNCAASTLSTISCVSTAPLAAGASRTLTLPVNITANAPASITNTVNVSGGGDSNTGNNAGSSVVNVTQIAPELTITKIANGTFQQGGTAAYTITVTNNGNGPTSSPFTVTDIIPTGLIPVLPLSSADWNCAASTVGTVSCTSTAPLAAGASRTLTLPVNITANAPASITNTVNVSGGGDSNTGNNAGTAVVNVTQIRPDLTVQLTGNGPFVRGNTASYTCTVNNVGNGPTTASFTVAGIIPTGLSIALPVSAPGFNCTASTTGQLSCVNLAPLAAGASIPLTFTVNIAANAPASITHTVSVSGGGESVTNNNAASSVVNVVSPAPDLTITKTTSSTFLQGGTATYTLTVHNAGNTATTSPYSILDSLPDGLTLIGSPTGAGWDFSHSTAAVLDCERSTAIPAGGSAPPVVITVSIPVNAPVAIKNTADTAGGGETNTANNSDSVTVEVSPGPEILVLGRETEIPNGDTKPDPEDDTDFGEVSVSASSVDHTFTIQNDGPGSLTISSISIAGLHAADFTVTRQPAESVPAGDVTAFTITFDPAATGVREAEVSIACNDADENPYTFAIMGTGLTDLQAWRLLHFGTTANTGIAANGFDAEKDGITNLVEFAFGLHPRLAGGTLPQPVTTAGSITYTFPQPALVSGITYRAEWSTSLTAGDWTAIPDTGTAALHVFTVPATGRARMFTRIVITAP